MPNLSLLFACLLIGISAAAQNQRRIDSLKSVLKTLEENATVTNAKIADVKKELATLQPAAKHKADYCNTYIQKEVDRMTGKTVFSAPKESVNVNKESKGLKIFWSLSEDSARIKLQFILVGISCVDTKEPINVMFSDGTRESFANSDHYNCDGWTSASFIRHFDFEKLDLFSLKEMSAVQVWSGNDFVDVEIPKANAATLRRSLICLRELKEMPTGGY